MMSSTASSSLHPLVTQQLVDTNKYFCPFLAKGYCREASRCNFSHDNCGSTKIPTDYCHFYLANQCLYGQDCKFRHSEPISDGVNQILNSRQYNIQDEWATPYSSPPFNDDGGDDNLNPTPAAAAHLYQPDLLILDFNAQEEREKYNQEEEEEEEEEEEDDEEIADDEQYYQASSANHERKQLDEELANKLSSSMPSIPTPINASSTARTLTSYAKICKSRLASDQKDQQQQDPRKLQPLCPYASLSGVCQFPTGHCSYLHGLDCDLCSRPCLHPYDLDQQRQHRDDCLREHEREMELSFAVQRSKDKVCGICMDTVVEKKPVTSSRFGILEKCNHIFCLDCIRRWRGTKQFETRTIRACPECRVNSDFVVPSKYWVEDQDDKDKLIHDYKAALRSKSCKYFNEGKGECPFAGSCFYKHAYPDGKLAELETPKPRRRVFGVRGPTSTVANYILWNILTSTDEDDWSNDELESLYQEPDYGTTDEDDFLEEDNPYEDFYAVPL